MPAKTHPTNEHERLADTTAAIVPPWRRWGCYVTERAWGTVREDYSPGGDAWGYLTHDQARSKAYRWGEDGIAGLCDRYQLLTFALALWNGKDPILRERMYGLTSAEGNRGDVPAGSALARPAALQRVLPRRQRRGPRRQPPDRVDGTRGEPDRRMAKVA